MKLSALLLPLLATAALAPRADAQVVELGFRHAFRHGGLSVHFDLGAPRADCRPVYRVWVPGHYECREERVWIAGECRRVWVEPIYAWRSDYRGCRQRIVVRAGYWETIQEPGHHETRKFQVWIEGHWTSP